MQFANQHRSASAFRFNQADMALGKCPSRLILFILFVLVWAFPITAQNTDFAGGNGTEADPYQISNVDELQAIQDASNTDHFILINDIDAAATAGWNNGNGFEPVSWFNGSLDGQGYTISNFTINRAGNYETALFAQVGSDGIFKNIHFESVNITGGNRTAALTGSMAGIIDNVSVSGNINGNDRVGGVVGNNAGSLSNSNSSATVTGNQYVGGLTGHNHNGTIENAHASGEVSGTEHVGGLAGFSGWGLSTYIKDSYAIALVEGSGDYVGGLVGETSGSLVENSYSEGEVTGQNRVGGLIGHNSGEVISSHSSSTVNGNERVGGLVGRDHNGTIETSFATGDVFANKQAGGLVGYAAWESSVIRQSYSTSRVEGTGNEIGGLVGELESGTVENSYSRGIVIGNNRVGGLVGLVDRGTINTSYAATEVNGGGGQTGGLVGRGQKGNANDAFWDTQVSGETGSDLGTGKTTSEMKTQATFTNWDFIDIWSTDPDINDGYPYLIALPPIVTEGTFFSRENGPWSDANTWSLEGHGGSPAPRAPGEDDDAIIGNNDIVTLTESITNNEGIITVAGTGTLVTNNFIISGDGEFSLESGGTLHVGSEEGITKDPSEEGNIQTAVRSFSGSANYVYDGTQAQQTGNGLPAAVNNLRINNPAGVTALANLTVNGQLQLDNGTFTMPPGKSLVTYDIDQGNGNVRMQLTINGQKGWRMIASPVQTSYSDLLDNFVSQGFSGSDYPELQPNIFWFDETELGTTNMAWRAPTGSGNTITGGRGHFFYIFNGAGMPDNNGIYDDELPLTMDATGIEYATGSTYNFTITHTPRSEEDITDVDIPEMNTGWNLVGNPSTASINWGKSEGWTKTNVDNVVYVWDTSANNGNGDFLVWNGDNGNMDNILIAPFQAFWVRANDSNPELSMNDNAKSLGGQFAGNSVPDKMDGDAEDPEIPDALELKLEAAGMNTTSLITFNEQGRQGEDPYDAYRLEPMSDNWLKLFTITSAHHLPMVINNLPPEIDEQLAIPVYMEGHINGSTTSDPYELTWSIPDNWPAHWQLTLMDHERQEAIPMQGEENNVQFQANNTKALSGDNPAAIPLNENFSMPGQIVSSGVENISGNNSMITGSWRNDNGSNLKTTPVEGGPRATIVITTGAHQDEIEYMAPEPNMLPVYPNPVQQQATIRFSLPETEEVTLNIYDIQGRNIRQLKNQTMKAGMHTVVWQPDIKLTSGIYMAVLQAGDSTSHQKMILMK